jgi:hypothetical protein
MSTRGADFLYRWISTRMPEGAIDDPVLVVTDLADEAMMAADAEGIASGEIDEAPPLRRSPPEIRQTSQRSIHRGSRTMLR